VARQRIVHPVRQRFEVSLRAHLRQHMTDQLHLAAKLDPVQFDKVLFDR
jgi:hypothetical protein